MRTGIVVAALAAVLGCLEPAAAQAPNATLVGRVLDRQGGVIPQASIEIRNTGTNELRRASSGDSGEFTVPNLPPGSYDISVQKEGFRRLEQKDLQLQVDQAARLDLRLDVGTVSDSIEVRAEAPLLNTENASRGDVIVTTEIAEMPLEDREFTDLAFLVPGVLPAAQGSQGSGMSINGARADNTNFMLDGFDNRGVSQGRVQVRPPIDAMQEFKMQVSGYSAEYGRLAGGVMNMVLKTGGNRLRGSLFEFLRNDALDARNFFDVEKSKLRRNQFGGTLSGPVYVPKLYNGRDRTFFLFAWESYRNVSGQVKRSRVPSALERAGDFSQTTDTKGIVTPLKDPYSGLPCTVTNRSGCFPGNRIPASQMSAAATKIVPYFPLPNRPEEANNLVAYAVNTDDWNSITAKGDHRFSEKDSLSVRYLTRGDHGFDPFSGSPGGGFGVISSRTQSMAGITWTHMFGPTHLNEARIGFTRTHARDVSPFTGHDYNAEFGIPGTTKEPGLVGFPVIKVKDYATIGDAASLPGISTVNTWQWADTLTLVRSRHLIRIGGDIVRSQYFEPYYDTLRGSFAFDGRFTNAAFGDFLMGLIQASERQVGAAPNYLFSTSYGGFVQDDFKWRPSIAISIGLRYELMKPPIEKYGRWANFVPALGKIVIADDSSVPDLWDRVKSERLTDRVVMAKDVGLPASLVYARYRDFAPRFGIAWRPGGGSRTVVRTGYGIFFANSISNPVREDLADIFPFALRQQFSHSSTPLGGRTFSNPFPTNYMSVEGSNGANGYDTNPPASYLQSWNFTVEREIGKGSAVEVAYAGSKGTHLGRRYNINQQVRTPAGNYRPFRGLVDIQYYAFGSTSIYNAGTVTFRKRFSSGFFYRVNYVYAKSIDDTSQLTGKSGGGYTGVMDSRNIKLERGRSDWDRGHTVTMNFSYELPFRRRSWIGGWQVAGTGRLYTGAPFTLFIQGALQGQGRPTRPDRIAKGRLEDRTVDRWYDVDAFPVVSDSEFRFGNAGRNILDGPGLASVNLSLSKRFRFGETGSLQLRGEAFNISNHTNFRLPNPNVNSKAAATITGASPARTIQLALRFQF